MRLHQHSGRIPGPAGAVGASDGAAALDGDLRIRPVRAVGRWARLRAKGGDPPWGEADGGHADSPCRERRPARRRAAPLTPAAPLSCAYGPRAQSHPDSLLSSWRCGPRAPVPVSAGATPENRALGRADMPRPRERGRSQGTGGNCEEAVCGANRDSWPSQLSGCQ